MEEKEKLIFPLRQEMYGGTHGIVASAHECDGERCAWWDASTYSIYGQCCIKTLAVNIRRLAVNDEKRLRYGK
jgi:hypothetical protein